MSSKTAIEYTYDRGGADTPNRHRIVGPFYLADDGRDPRAQVADHLIAQGRTPAVIRSAVRANVDLDAVNRMLDRI